MIRKSVVDAWTPQRFIVKLHDHARRQLLEIERRCKDLEPCAPAPHHCFDDLFTIEGYERKLLVDNFDHTFSVPTSPALPT